MGQPNWSKIPFEKLPQWKKDEMLAAAKKTIENIEGEDKFRCSVCGKVCASKAGMKAHARIHKN